MGAVFRRSVLQSEDVLVVGVLAAQKVVGCVPGPPFDVAADAGFLFLGHGSAFEGRLSSYWPR